MGEKKNAPHPTPPTPRLTRVDQKQKGMKMTNQNHGARSNEHRKAVVYLDEIVNVMKENEYHRGEIGMEPYLDLNNGSITYFTTYAEPTDDDPEVSPGDRDEYEINRTIEAGDGVRFFWIPTTDHGVEHRLFDNFAVNAGCSEASVLAKGIGKGLDYLEAHADVDRYEFEDFRLDYVRRQAMEFIEYVRRQRPDITIVVR